MSSSRTRDAWKRFFMAKPAPAVFMTTLCIYSRLPGRRGFGKRLARVALKASKFWIYYRLHHGGLA